eukprot:TRINITY_DN7853_c0_g1_i5.p1 TRINITY_DN7853_c0_g1~~TRINITY_DN7853_c0_g1_i5.p1  ORF type:complete len:844 (-),score=143.43 TRINITY_DN7853_c0_g1_i5:33-2564(-)
MSALQEVESLPINEPSLEEPAGVAEASLSEADALTGAERTVHTRRHLVMAAGISAMAALALVLFASSVTAPGTAVSARAAKQRSSAPAPDRDLGYTSIHIASAAEETKNQFYPAVCAGQSLQAGFTLAGFGIKVISAYRECNQFFYEDDLSRRLSEEDEDHPLLKLHKALTKPLLTLPSNPGIQQNAKEHITSLARQMREQGGDESEGEVSYNVSDWDLLLENVSAELDHDWTLEGWHYLSSHGGVVLDTRNMSSNSTTPGVVAAVAQNGSQALLVFSPGGGVLELFSSVAVPLRKWVHLVWQRQDNALTFYTGGKASGKFDVPWKVGNGTRVLLGRAVDQHHTSSKLRGLISNVRLTASPVYGHASTCSADRHLEQLNKTLFLLQSGYLDQVSGREMDVEGAGENAGIRSKGFHRLLQDQDRLLGQGPFFRPTTKKNPNSLNIAPRGVPVPIEPDDLSAWCGRTILTLIKDAGTIASNVETDLKVCQDAKLTGNLPCAASATKVIRAAANAGKYLAETPVRGCNQQWFDGYYKCGERLEGAAWEFDGLGTDLGETIERCSMDPVEHIGKDGKPINYGSCVGEVFSSAGYLTTSALYLTSGVKYDCPSAKSTNQGWAYQNLCAQESLGFARTLFLGSTKAVRAGGSCPGVDTVCAQNALLSLAAFTGVGQVGAIIDKDCKKLKNPCCKFDPVSQSTVCSCQTVKEQQDWNAAKLKRDGKCGRYSGSFVKLLFAAVSFAQEAQEACDDSNQVQMACGSMIAFMIASLGYFAENAARNHYECPFGKGQDLYQCGQDQSKIGEAIERFTSSTAAAVINCGALSGRDEVPDTRLVGMVHPPRRFFMV